MRVNRAQCAFDASLQPDLVFKQHTYLFVSVSLQRFMGSDLQHRCHYRSRIHHALLAGSRSAR